MAEDWGWRANSLARDGLLAQGLLLFASLGPLMPLVCYLVQSLDLKVCQREKRSIVGTKHFQNFVRIMHVLCNGTVGTAECSNSDLGGQTFPIMHSCMQD